MTTLTATDPTRAPEIRTIGLVGLVHGTSHFFHLLLPPLFPWLIRDFGMSYAQVGGLMTVFFVVSALGQAASGFLVDRAGPRPVLVASLALFVLAALVLAGAQSPVALALAAALAGLGNASFHPVDFTILNRRIGNRRIGHAFSTHGISGNLGWALAPVYLAGIAGATGSWRIAALTAAALAAVVLLVVWWRRDDLTVAAVHRERHTSEQAEPMFAFLKMPALWLCFSFFFFTTLALGAVQGFVVPALQKLYELPLTTANLVLTGYMLVGATGMVLGGFLTARVHRLERVVALCLLSTAGLMVLVGTGVLPGVSASLLMVLAGFGVGIAGPSRDLLIKRSTPPGATGRVYGTVYSGLDIGLAVSPLIFGTLLDAGRISEVFVTAAGCLGLAILSATLVGRRLVSPKPAVGTTVVVLLAVLALGTLPEAAQARQTVQGRVVGVADGDTITLLTDSREQIRVRLVGIDAPERTQPFSQASRKALSDAVFNKTVTVEGAKRDRYGRLLGVIRHEGRDINLMLIQEGWAWHMKPFERQQSAAQRREYAAAEVAAREARRGLWADPNPQAPWEYRRQRRESR